jgi:glyoxylase-like metal-dependent hydrolase (beta-lactamase superfamily II)
VTVEVAPGIHRIESVLGPRPFSQYLLRDERSLLFDTGVKETPAEVILPFLDGLEPDLVLNSHADVDHFGGNAAIRAAAPQALFLAHELDVPWIESADAIMRERYGWYAAHELAYDDEVFAWLRDAMGPDTPIDLRLQGGEKIRLGPRLIVEVLHLPGHSPGHVGLWDPTSRTAIVMDAVLGRGLLDMNGTVIAPPPYFDVEAYLGAARQLQALQPDRLLTAHYDVIEGGDVERFLADTIEFVGDAGRIVEESLAEVGTLTLPQALAIADPRLGPFTSMPNELAGSLRAHLRQLAAEGRVREDASGRSWTAINEKGVD